MTALAQPLIGDPGGRPTLVCDPSTGEGKYRLGAAGGRVAEAAIAAARAAQPAWADLPAIERGERLRMLAAEVRHDPDLARLMSSDVGKPISEARVEQERAARIFEYYAGLASGRAGELYEDATGQQVRVVRRARGVVLLITPWNFPVAIPCWKLAPALLAGNAAVLKPSTPATRIGIRLAEAAWRAGIPAHCCKLVPGGGETAQALVDADPDMISFTGSTGVGRSIHERTSGRLVPLQLEMGGKNALYVSEAADPSDAARIALIGAMGYAGQKCTATSRVYAGKRLFARLLSALQEQVARLAIGDPSAEETVVGPVISETARDQAVQAVSAASGRGVDLVVGGQIHGERGHFMQPTIMQGGDADDPIYRDELFAPILAVRPTADLDEAIELIDAVQYGLVAGIVSPLREEIETFAARVDAGVIRVNAPTTGLEPHVPFGGLKGSSFGPREQGTFGLEAFRETKTIYG